MLTKSQGLPHTGNDQLTPIETLFSVVEAVKMMVSFGGRQFDTWNILMEKEYINCKLKYEGQGRRLSCKMDNSR